MALNQHPRSSNLAQAEAALTVAIAELAKNFGQTTAEVCAALSTVQNRWVGYALREEREKQAS